MGPCLRNNISTARKKTMPFAQRMAELQGFPVPRGMDISGA
jgi:hypothetical protein